VIEIINRYFEQMVNVIGRFQGTVSEFMGDGILVFFGAPLCADDDPERAVACAIEMQNALSLVNAEQSRMKLPELAMGIGINTGEVVVGNIGSERRASYGAVGTPINAAYRIESFTVGGQVLISPSTQNRIVADLKIRGTKEVEFKGLIKPVTLHDVVGIGSPYNVFLQEKVAIPMTRLISAIPIECFLIKGKTVSDTVIAGHITHIGENSADVIMDKKLSADSNLKVVLANPENQEMSEWYAKVLSNEKPGGSALNHRVLLEFTSITQGIKDFLDRNRSGIR
jgi:adenylate cyclase